MPLTNLKFALIIMQFYMSIVTLHQGLNKVIESISIYYDNKYNYTKNTYPFHSFNQTFIESTPWTVFPCSHQNITIIITNFALQVLLQTINKILVVQTNCHPILHTLTLKGSIRLPVYPATTYK